ncbi:alpha/beta fold hydrolase [Sphingomonas sp. IC4-52]|uniref:alpha/beta fold hydrolase n=1 Tax=Sphingomonas sp. IC4-52 TaxID=2887202 RepID=UPI001D10A63D|nr:alpha/beta hydrolase [Sphingomonas sp. IC4-52]MCC2980929.1 alpha/beta hydrolase [Sphingomonas sp. IC4-52]
MSAEAVRRRDVRTPDGLTIALDEGGPANAPTVVLLHGGGQTRHSWSAAMRALVAGGYRVINFDARGHGDSMWSPEGDYLLDHRASDLRAVVGETRPLALVGASLGGATSLHAVAQGLAVDALVLVDITPHPEPAGIERITSFMRRHTDGFATLDEAVDAVAAYNPHRPRPRDPSGLRRNLREHPDGRLRWHWDPKIIGTAPAVHHATVRVSADRIAAGAPFPLMLVRGLSSDIVSDESVAAFRALLPWAEVADVAGAGHMIAGDRNDAFNAAILDFLARHLPVQTANPATRT